MQKDLGKKKSRLLERGILLSLLLLSFLLRISLYNIQTSDYVAFFGPDYDFIRVHGGFAALKYTFSDYNPPYLYLLALVTYTPLPKLAAIKTLSIVFDAVIALFTYLILRLKYKRSYVPIIGVVVILFSPTLFMNSAAWGQNDAMYTACCLGSLYFLLSERPAWACLFFGLAISFKLQAIFFLPVLIVLFSTRKLSIKSLIFIPTIYLVLLAPAFFEGRSAWSLLTIYVGEAKEYQSLTLNAPNFYQWLPGAAFQDWRSIGIQLAAMMVVIMNILTVMSNKRITSDIILKLTLVFTLVMPFFLPQMHERYFYLADIVSIIYAFYFPCYWYVAVLEQLCSLMSYAPLLSNIQVVNLAYVAGVVLVLIVITLADLLKTLYPTIHVKDSERRQDDEERCAVDGTRGAIAFWQGWKKWRMSIGMCILLVCIAMYLRSLFFDIPTLDYNAYFSRWYDFIQSHGGFAALKYNFSNYNVSYFYLFTLMTYIPIPKIIGYKLIPVCFDLLMARFMYLIVRLKYKESSMPMIASLVVLFAPTVVIMSGLWGQFESIYASLCLGGLYFLLRKQPLWACLCFGLAVSFKPQPLFLFPLLFVLLITGELPKRYVLIIPVTYLITVLPACLLGRGFIDVLMTYRSRADNPWHSLTISAPTIFQWLPATPFASWDAAGIILAFSAVGMLSFVVLISQRKMTNEVMLKIALIFVVLVPFLLPEMHERYFYLADIVSLVYAFYFLKYFYIPIFMQISSLMSYSPYLGKDAPINLKYTAFLVLGVIMITTSDLVKTLFSTSDQGLEQLPDCSSEIAHSSDDACSAEGSSVQISMGENHVAEDPDKVSVKQLREEGEETPLQKGV